MGARIFYHSCISITSRADCPTGHKAFEKANARGEDAGVGSEVIVIRERLIRNQLNRDWQEA